MKKTGTYSDIVRAIRAGKIIVLESEDHRLRGFFHCERGGKYYYSKHRDMELFLALRDRFNNQKEILKKVSKLKGTISTLD